MSRRSNLAVYACLMLAACAHAPSGSAALTIQRVLVPVPQPCAADPGPKPSFPDEAAAILAAPNLFERAKLYSAGRQARLDWEARLEAANAGCRPPPGAATGAEQGAPREP